MLEYMIVIHFMSILIIIAYGILEKEYSITKFRKPLFAFWLTFLWVLLFIYISFK